MPPIEPPATENNVSMSEIVEQHRLRAHHVADGDNREIRGQGVAVAGLVEAGPV